MRCMFKYSKWRQSFLMKTAIMDSYLIQVTIANTTSYRVAPQCSDDFSIFQRGYLIALGRRHLNPEFNSLCPWHNRLVLLKS